MSPWELLAVAVAGVGAGFINSVAGSGSLITFPTLLALGVPPVTANVSNNIGLVPGGVAGAIAWRHELRGHTRRLLLYAIPTVLGAVTGAVLLLVLPTEVFSAVVPVLIALSLLLVAFQPWIMRRFAVERAGPRSGQAWWLWPVLGLTTVYGGYFGAAQGIMMIALLGVAASGTLHHHNAVKNVLGSLVNSVAAVVFLLAAEIDWAIVAVIAVGSVLGAQSGSAVGRRMSPGVLRGLIVIVASVALAVYLLRE